MDLIKRTRFGMGILFLIIFNFGSSGSSLGGHQASLAYANFFRPLAAVAQQSTSYPVSTSSDSTGYPDQATATSSSDTPTATFTPFGSPTETSPVLQSATPTPLTTMMAAGTTLAPGTSSTNSQDNLFQTENAEMGQSSATLLPSETTTMIPELTPEFTPKASNSATSQAFAMNWLGFGIGLLAVLVIGGGVGWFLLHRQKNDLQL